MCYIISYYVYIYIYICIYIYVYIYIYIYSTQTVNPKQRKNIHNPLQIVLINVFQAYDVALLISTRQSSWFRAESEHYWGLLKLHVFGESDYATIQVSNRMLAVMYHFLSLYVMHVYGIISL